MTVANGNGHDAKLTMILLELDEVKDQLREYKTQTNEALEQQSSRIDMLQSLQPLEHFVGVERYEDAIDMPILEDTQLRSLKQNDTLNPLLESIADMRQYVSTLSDEEISTKFYQFLLVVTQFVNSTQVPNVEIKEPLGIFDEDLRGSLRHLVENMAKHESEFGILSEPESLLVELDENKDETVLPVFGYSRVDAEEPTYIETMMNWLKNNLALEGKDMDLVKVDWSESSGNNSSNNSNADFSSSEFLSGGDWYEMCQSSDEEDIKEKSVKDEAKEQKDEVKEQKEEVREPKDEVKEQKEEAKDVKDEVKDVKNAKDAKDAKITKLPTIKNGFVPLHKTPAPFQIFKVRAKKVKCFEHNLRPEGQLIIKIFDPWAALYWEDKPYSEMNEFINSAYKAEKHSIETLSKDPKFHNCYYSHNETWVQVVAPGGVSGGKSILRKHITTVPLPKNEETFQKVKQQLEVIHKHGIAHNDIAGNILHTKRGKIYIVGFGKATVGGDFSKDIKDLESLFNVK